MNFWYLSDYLFSSSCNCLVRFPFTFCVVKNGLLDLLVIEVLVNIDVSAREPWVNRLLLFAFLLGGERRLYNGDFLTSKLSRNCCSSSSPEMLQDSLDCFVERMIFARSWFAGSSLGAKLNMFWGGVVSGWRSLWGATRGLNFWVGGALSCSTSCLAASFVSSC